MAKTKNGILDGFEGKLGTVIGYRWKGVECMRAVNAFPHDPRTQAQMKCRTLFRTLSQLGSDMLQAARLGFRGPADAGHTTEYNCFIRANKQCVASVDDGAQVDYPALSIADGPLDEVVFEEPLVDNHLQMNIDFHPKASRRRDDYVLLYAYTPALRQGLLSPPVYCSQRRATLMLPDRWRGHDLHLYGFCWDGDRQASPSSHLGTLTPQ
ncbi:MAG: hypothetical protein IJ524_09950 [Bacteroidales bacterium]|nr:hypothetical protein [Bacteroidales bacterium]